MDEKELLKNVLGEAPDDIRALFDRLKQKEKDWLDHRTNKTKPAVEAIFAENAGPKFVSLSYDEIGDALSWKKQYLELVEELKTASDNMLWYRLGVWFKAEGIRDPVTFFPESILKRLLKEFKISVGDMRNVYLIRLWLPYTEPLMRKAKWLRGSGLDSRMLKRNLEQLGYDRKAVVLLTTTKIWRSSVEFTSDWVASRTVCSSDEKQRENLVNSYSRCFSFDKRGALCYFCRQRAVGEFWVSEEAIAHCEDHKPDNLPKSRDRAWRDWRSRRLWWREDLYIRRALPGAAE